MRVEPRANLDDDDDDDNDDDDNDDDDDDDMDMMKPIRNDEQIREKGF